MEQVEKVAGLFDEAGGQGITTWVERNQGPQPRKSRCQHPDQAWREEEAGGGAQLGSLMTDVSQGLRHS